MLFRVKKAYIILLVAPLLSLSVGSCSTDPGATPLCVNLKSVVFDSGTPDKILNLFNSKNAAGSPYWDDLQLDLNKVKATAPTDGSADGLVKAVNSALSASNKPIWDGSELRTAEGEIKDYYKSNCT
ncbi:MAG: hypothetical protein ACJAY5_000632 [Actinomycetes bacterium]|jgi:hypothetical protein